jgi:hypothetical protein
MVPRVVAGDINGRLDQARREEAYKGPCSMLSEEVLERISQADSERSLRVASRIDLYSFSSASTRSAAK